MMRSQKRRKLSKDRLTTCEFLYFFIIFASAKTILCVTAGKDHIK